MKSLPRLLVAAVALAIVLMPLALLADQLPAPLEKKINPGVTTIEYAGQTLRFTTPVSLIINLDPISTTQIRLSVRTYGTTSGPQGAAAATDVNIYWEDFDNDVYNGPPPPTSSPWEGILYTESGYTEK